MSTLLLVRSLALTCVVTLGVLVQPTALGAQEPGAPPPTARRDYQIGPGDLLSIAVSGLKEFDRVARVSNSGRIHVPHVGIVPVNGLSVTDVQAAIARRLQEGGLMNDPWVTVRVVQYRAQPVYILGEVINPGQFVIQDEMYLIDLITLAGGFNEVATPVGFLYRRQATAGEPGADTDSEQAIPIDFKALNEGVRPDLNLRLRGGDVLYVPQRRKDYFYVVGDVAKPGAVELLHEAPPILATQAIAKAGGPLRTAKLGAGVIVRTDEAGQRLELPFDFRRVYEGKQPDIPIRPNDIVFIPGSNAKTLGYGLIGAIPLVMQQAVP